MFDVSFVRTTNLVCSFVCDNVLTYLIPGMWFKSIDGQKYLLQNNLVSSRVYTRITEPTKETLPSQRMSVGNETYEDYTCLKSIVNLLVGKFLYQVYSQGTIELVLTNFLFEMTVEASSVQ